jgi:hypothetical protein
MSLDGELLTFADYDTRVIPFEFVDSLQSICVGQKPTSPRYSLNVTTTFYNHRVNQNYAVTAVGTRTPGQVKLSVPLTKPVTINYYSKSDIKTVLWNGTTSNSISANALSDCKCIHFTWTTLEKQHDITCGLLLVPVSYSTDVGCIIRVSAALTATHMQPAPDRSLVIYLADTAGVMQDTHLSYDLIVTDGVEANLTNYMTLTPPATPHNLTAASSTLSWEA